MASLRDEIHGRLSAEPTGKNQPFPWDDQPVSGPCSLCGPLTETHEDPDVLWQNQKLESLGLLAGGVAHDFNNHLLAIVGNADLLAQDLPPGSPHRILLDEIRRAADRAGNLCGQLAAFAGKGQYQLESVDLSATVAGMVSMLKVALSRKVGLCLDLTPRVPAIAGDRARMQQVVMNLVVNAAEAIGSDGGTVTLRTGECRVSDHEASTWVLAPRRASASYVFLDVKDTGSGMSAATIARAFDPFYTSKPRGRGLGLASVLGIVRSHYGGVVVDSAPGQGTAVTVLMPVRPATQQRPTALPRRRSERSGGTILIVDDEE